MSINPVKQNNVKSQQLCLFHNVQQVLSYKSKNLWPKTLLEREALVMVFLTQKRLRNDGNTNFCQM